MTQELFRFSAKGRSSKSIHITGSLPSLPWLCQEPFGVRIRSPRDIMHFSPSTAVQPPSPESTNRLALGGCRWTSADSPGLYQEQPPYMVVVIHALGASPGLANSKARRYASSIGTISEALASRG